MTRWNERRIYASYTSYKTSQWQDRFLEAVRLECPAVLQELRARVLPAFVGADEALARASEVRNLKWHPGRQETSLDRFRALEGLPKSPPCAEAIQARKSWAVGFNIDVQFVHGAAQRVLAAWNDMPPPQGAPLAWHGGEEIFEYLGQQPLDQTPLQPWDPLREPLHDFRERIRQHIESRKAVAHERGWVPAGSRIEIEECHFRWLVCAQVLGEGAKTIGALCKDRPDLRPTYARPGSVVPTRTIEDAMRVIREALKLPGRRRGRPTKKNHAG